MLEAISCHNFSSCCHFVTFGLLLFVVLSLHQGILVLSLQLLVQVLLLLSLHFRIVRSNFLLYLFCLFVFVISARHCSFSYRFTKGFLVLFLSSLDFSSYCRDTSGFLFRICCYPGSLVVILLPTGLENYHPVVAFSRYRLTQTSISPEQDKLFMTVDQLKTCPLNKGNFITS